MDNESAPRSYEIDNMYSLGGLPENEGAGTLYNTSTFQNEQTYSGGTVNDGTMQDVLAKSIGRYVVCELLIGANNTVVKEGFLNEVGRSYFTLLNEDSNAVTICDFYTLKLATCYKAGEKPAAYAR
jgi:hypothetical protein